MRKKAPVTVSRVKKVEPAGEMDIRLNRLIGQLEGVRRMINSKRKTEEVVQQILAAREALSRVGILLLKADLAKKADTKHTKSVQKLLDTIFRV